MRSGSSFVASAVLRAGRAGLGLVADAVAAAPDATATAGGGRGSYRVIARQ